jgi:hypothetical protein
MKRKPLVFAVALAMSLLAANRASAQHIVNGDLWLNSSQETRKAFLLGAGNMLAVETAYAKKRNLTPPPAGALMSKAISGMTLDQVSDRITRWYKANPQRRNVPVMGVVWIDIVKPTIDSIKK